VEDLLTLSRLESQEHSEAETVAMQPMLATLRREAEAHSQGRHQISIDDLAGVDLQGSTKELHSAFSNLVTNAVRYTPAGGRVTLAWEDGPDGAAFSVEDTGAGIAPEHIPRLTERFYRVDRSRSRETGGTGLGLAIVKHALARHQAQLEIASTPGAGSRFTARFPATRTIPLETATQPAAE
jgi:two-component system phosphate regulon sensor histidine kinase PhoR